MTRNLHIYTLALLSLASTTYSLRQGSHQLRDLFAYPKYEIQFLNDLPLSQSDAERCKLRGVNEGDWITPSPSAKGLIGGADGRKRLGDGGAGADGEGDIVEEREALELIPMNFAHPEEPNGPPYPYLCLMPSHNATHSQTEQIDRLDEVEEVELDPVQGWAAMSHLDGKCLYSRQGWFTYSYCHNSHIRQFRQAAHAHPHPPGGIVPAEDTTYDAYTLGQVSPGARQRTANAMAAVAAGGGETKTGQPAAQQNQAERKNQKPFAPKGPAGGAADENEQSSLTTAGAGTGPVTGTGVGVQNQNPSVSVSFGHGASSRYLVQRWSYGTRCDKTGRPREVEVQIHCSMTTGDMIYMIKEISICHYVVIIHSPYLCDLPGFKSRDLGEIKAAPIRCRQVVDDEDYRSWENERSIKDKERLDQGAESQAGNGQNSEDTLELPFGKRPTGADNPIHELLEGKQRPANQFGLGPEAGMIDISGVRTGAAGGNEFEDVEVVFAGNDVPADQLEMLRIALESLSKRKQSKGADKDGEKGATGSGEAGEGRDEDEEEVEQVIFYSWEEGEDGSAILLDAESLLSDGEGEAQDGKIGQAGGRIAETEKPKGSEHSVGKEEKLGSDRSGREMLEDVLRQYLSKKDKSKRSKGDEEEAREGEERGEIVRDEL